MKAFFSCYTVVQNIMLFTLSYSDKQSGKLNKKSNIGIQEPQISTNIKDVLSTIQRFFVTVLKNNSSDQHGRGGGAQLQNSKPGPKLAIPHIERMKKFIHKYSGNLTEIVISTKRCRRCIVDLMYSHSWGDGLRVKVWDSSLKKQAECSEF